MELKHALVKCAYNGAHNRKLIGQIQFWKCTAKYVYNCLSELNSKHKIKVLLKPKVLFILELIDKQLGKSHGTLFLYMTVAMRLIYARNGKNW